MLFPAVLNNMLLDEIVCLNLTSYICEDNINKQLKSSRL